MDLSNFADQFNEVVDSLISGGSRYQVEKLATVVVYVIVAGASVVWAFSGGGAGDELGARFEVEELTEIDDQNFHLINDSDEDWSRVRVVINQKYLWTTDTLEAGRQKTLSPKDFEYYFYLPRPWGRQPWEQLSEKAKPGPKAPTELDVEFVQIRAREGSSDKALGGAGQGDAASGSDNVAEAAE